MDRNEWGIFGDVASAMTEQEGALDPELRTRLLDGELPDGPLGALAKKVIERVEPVTDADIRALLDAGISEDAIFECILAAGLGAGFSRLRHGLTIAGVPR
jgi:hypothetical protein